MDDLEKKLALLDFDLQKARADLEFMQSMPPYVPKDNTRWDLLACEIIISLFLGYVIMRVLT